jgi:hypothetical protein
MTALQADFGLQSCSFSPWKGIIQRSPVILAAFDADAVLLSEVDVDRLILFGGGAYFLVGTHAVDILDM